MTKVAYQEKLLAIYEEFEEEGSAGWKLCPMLEVTGS